MSPPSRRERLLGLRVDAVREPATPAGWRDGRREDKAAGRVPDEVSALGAFCCTR